MKPRTLLILLLVVAGLGAFIWFYERDLPGSEERAERAKRVLRGLEAEEVTALVIETEGERVRLERVADEAAAEDEGEEPADEDEEPAPPAEPEPEWRIAEPASLAGARADRLAVDRLLEQLVSLEKSRTIEVEEADRAAAGLEKPRAEVTLVTGEGGETTLEIGAEVPASTSMLAALAGRPEIYVVGGGVYHDLARAPGEWRDHDLFSARRDQIERVTLAPAGGERVVLTRRGDEELWLDEPLVDRADTSAVEQLLGDLTALRAQRFVDEPGEPTEEDAGGEEAEPGEEAAAGGEAAEDGTPADPWGLADPRGVVEVAIAGGDPFRLEIGGEAAGAGWYGRTGGQLFEATGMLPERLEKDPAEWQSHSLSARRLYQIDRVTVEEAGAEPLVLEREGPDWRRGGEAIPYTPVSDFLFAVTDARAERLARRDAARAAGHLGEPELSITLAAAESDDGGAAEGAETVALYPPADDGTVPATVTGRDFALYLSPASAETLHDSLNRLREAEPLPDEPEVEEGDAEDGIEIEVEEADPEEGE